MDLPASGAQKHAAREASQTNIAGNPGRRLEGAKAPVPALPATLSSRETSGAGLHGRRPRAGGLHLGYWAIDAASSGANVGETTMQCAGSGTSNGRRIL